MSKAPALREVEIETHTTCNARCVYCAYPFIAAEKPPARMDQGVFARVVSELDFARGELERVHLHHVNEPLLNPRLAEHIRFVRRTLPGIEVGFSTNAILLTPRKTEKLLDAGLNLIYITIPSSDPDEYARIMGIKADVNRVLENTAYFIDSARAGTRIVIRSPVGFDKKLRQFLERFDDNIVIEEMELMGRLGETRLAQRGSGTLSGRPAPCRLPWVKHTLIVAADGRVPLCCNDQKHLCIVETVADKSVQQAWTSADYARARDATQNRNRPEDFICNRCEFGVQEGWNE